MASASQGDGACAAESTAAGGATSGAGTSARCGSGLDGAGLLGSRRRATVQRGVEVVLLLEQLAPDELPRVEVREAEVVELGERAADLFLGLLRHLAQLTDHLAGVGGDAGQPFRAEDEQRQDSEDHELEARDAEHGISVRAFAGTPWVNPEGRPRNPSGSGPTCTRVQVPRWCALVGRERGDDRGDRLGRRVGHHGVDHRPGLPGQLLGRALNDC